MGANASATDVPLKYDLVVNGTGFILDRRQEPNAVHEYTPTFVDRTNVTGSYGDNTQDFWMVLAQNDWGGGEQQRFIRVNDAESRRRYWQGSAVDISIDGQVMLTSGTVSLATAGTVISSVNWAGVPVFAVSTSLYRLSTDGASVSTIGTYTTSFSGLGAYGLAADDVNVFIACPSGGSDGAVLKWNGTAFSTFSAGGGITSLEFLNNTLFGVGATSTGKTILYSYDTAGTRTTIYTWQTADGQRDNKVFGRLRKFGGTLLLSTLTLAGQLFQYEIDAPQEIAQYPPDYLGTEVCVAEGIIFIGGAFLKYDYTLGKYLHQPAILYYFDGQLNELWRADRYETTGTSSATDTTLTSNPVPYLNGVLWWDPIRAQLTYYDIRTGAINGVSASTSVTGLGCFSGVAFFNGPSSGVAGYFPNGHSLASTGYVASSLFDADSALPKYWKSVKVDADLPTGASVDIAYQLNDVVAGSYTNVQTGATSGTEYAIGQSSRSISIKVTLNSGSGGSPVLKRIYLRGTPVLDSFRRDTFIVDCCGRDARNPVRLRDGSDENQTGLELATALRTAASATSPFTVTDEFGSYTALIDTQTFRLEKVRDREYRAQFTVRQVGA